MLYTVRNPKRISSLGLASFAFARHYSQNLGWFLFLVLLRCFSSDRSPHIPILFSIWCMDFTPYGLLHSDICALTFAYNYTQLFAVNHVLLRLPMPRHSPCALISFTICSLRLYYEFSLTKKVFLLFYFLLLNDFFNHSPHFAFLLCFFIQFSSYLLHSSQLKNTFQWITSLLTQIHSSISFFLLSGHKWTRTTDLTLIRRAL